MVDAGSTLGRRHRVERGLLIAIGTLLVVFLALPLIGLTASVSWSDFIASLDHPLVSAALRLSLFTTTTSLVVVLGLGTPLAWSLARGHGRFMHLLEIIVELPIVIPPAVAGVAMLLAFGRRGLLAGWLYPQGWSVAFTTPAVIMAEVFVSAPFFVQAAVSAFRRVDDNLIVVARTFGASPLRVFFRIAVPLATPGLVAGAIMSWARSLGEFGATLMFAGNLQGRTQTLPLAIYTALESDLRVARALAMLLLLVAFGLLLGLRVSMRAGAEQAGTAS
jgi:molybdate transport system permease protein